VTKLEYRPDIDALRALAVMSVIFFHIKSNLLPGGFLGVDIFFVISGYLITRIILNHEGSIGSFFPNFYERRIRRLIPPAIPVIIFSFVAGCIWLSAGQLESLSKSIIAYSGFVSNWLFLSEVNYFDTPAHYKPLLHTWSLSVEEQFYVLFPIVILLLKKRSASLVKFFFMAVFVLSLTLSYYLILTGQKEAAFFNSFARFWEIALGGLLACGILPKLSSAAVKDLLCAMGLILIAASLILTKETMDFGGLGSLAPTFGTAFVIYASSERLGKLISLPPARQIGLISYAMYLWHWPLFVYIKFVFPQAGALHYLAAIALTIALSTTSYVLIEQPIRKKTFLKSRKSAFWLLVVTTLIFVSVSITTIYAKGGPSRYTGAKNYDSYRSTQLAEWHQKSLRTQCWIDHRESLAAIVDTCITFEKNKPNILLLGDSHAAHLLPGLKSNFPNLNISLLAVDSCALAKRPPNQRPACNELSEWVDEADLHRFDAILFSSRNLPAGIPKQTMQLIDKMASESKLYLFGPSLYFEPNMPTLYPTLRGKFTKEEIGKKFEEALSQDQFNKDKTFKKQFSLNADINYVSMIDIMCSNGTCEFWDKEGWPILIDNSHMSVEASDMFMSRFKLDLRELKNS